MDFIAKIGQVLLILGVIYLWNKYIVEFIIRKVIGFHKKNNKQNLNKQPINFFVENESNIINFGKAFYWFGGIMIIFGIITK